MKAELMTCNLNFGIPNSDVRGSGSVTRNCSAGGYVIFFIGKRIKALKSQNLMVSFLPLMGSCISCISGNDASKYDIRRQGTIEEDDEIRVALCGSDASGKACFLKQFRKRYSNVPLETSRSTNTLISSSSAGCDAGMLKEVFYVEETRFQMTEIVDSEWVPITRSVFFNLAIFIMPISKYDKYVRDANGELVNCVVSFSLLRVTVLFLFLIE